MGVESANTRSEDDQNQQEAGTVRAGHLSGTEPARAIVLAGVHAWGGCALDGVTTRPLLPIAGRPLVVHVLEWLRSAGIQDVTLCGNSQTSNLRRRLGNGESLGLSLHYYADVMPRGPAGCARDAALSGEADQYVVVDGTILPAIDLGHILKEHRQSGAAVTVVAAQSTNAHGTPAGAPEPLGIYVFERSELAAVAPSGYQDIKEGLIPQVYARGKKVRPFVAEAGQAARVFDATSYLAADNWVMERMIAGEPVLDGYVRVNDAWVHTTAEVAETARFVGPVIVGPRAIIGPHVVLVGAATIGAASTVGTGAVVSRSNVWERCRIGDGAMLDHCVVTTGARVEPGTSVRERAILRSQSSGVKALLGGPLGRFGRMVRALRSRAGSKNRRGEQINV